MRVIVTALAICAVSFVADVAGDLSVVAHRPVDQAQAASARVDLPPYLEGAVRAHPLPPRAREHRPGHAVAMAANMHKPHARQGKSAPKGSPDRAPKLGAAKA